jgi:hypothetical protein
MMHMGDSSEKARSAATDLSRADWRKAARSNGANTGCVEVAGNLPSVTAIRDSTRPSDGAHIVPRAAFAAFLQDLKTGRFDL